MSKCREAFEAWWKSNGIELESYAEKAAAKKGWQTAWNARGKVDAEICRAVGAKVAYPLQLVSEGFAEEVEKENTSGWIVNQPTETKCVAMCFKENETQKQEPFPFSAERVTYHKAGAIGAIMPCGTMVTNVKEAYEAGQAAPPVVQPDTVLVPRVPTDEMLAVIRNERGAYGTGEALYADLIAAAEGKK